MATSPAPLSDKLDSLLAGEVHSDAVLRAASAQMTRINHLMELELEFEWCPSPPGEKRYQFSMAVVEACRSSGLFPNETDGFIMNAAHAWFTSGIDGCQTLLKGESDPQVSCEAQSSLGDASLILRACEKAGLLKDAENHYRAHKAAVNGEWDNPTLLSVGPMLCTSSERAEQIDEHYLGLQSLKRDLDTLLSTLKEGGLSVMQAPSSIDPVNQQMTELKQRILTMGLSDDPQVYYDVYAEMSSEDSSDVAKTYVNKKLLLRLVDLAGTAERMEVAEISDYYAILWPEASYIRTDLDRIEVGRYFSNEPNLGRHSIQFRATEKCGSMVYTSEALSLNDLLDRVEEMVQAERTALVFSGLPDPKGEELQEKVDLFERKNVEHPRLDY